MATLFEVGCDDLSSEIVELSKLGENCLVTESAIENNHLGDGETGEVAVKTYDVEKVNGSEDMELLLKDTESVGRGVEVQPMKEIVEVIENYNKSDIVVMENVDDEQPLEKEATDDPIVTVSAVSQFLEKNCVDETQPNIQLKGSAEDLEVTDIEVCDQPTLTFPASFVSLDINVQFGSFGDVKSALKVSNPEVESECGSNINSHELILLDLQEHDRNVTCEGVDDMDDGQWGGQRAELPVVQTEEDDDERLKEQINNAQMQLDEKRRCREAIKAEMHIKFGSMIVYREAFKAKNLKLRAALLLVKSKRKQIDQVQCGISKVKNTIAVEDIDSRIYKVEHMIKNGQLCLKDGKELTREIKHLKIMRVQLALNMCSPDEIQHALDAKDQKEELLKTLNTELKALRYKVSKAQVASDTIRKKHAEEHKMERELRAQFIAAEESCRVAKAHLHILKKQLSNKNKCFHMYEEESILARKSASCTEEAAVHHVCTKQVGSFIDKWSTSEECNMFSTQDELSRVLPDFTDESVASNSGPNPDEVKSTSTDTNLESEETVEGKHSVAQIKENVVEEFEQMVMNKEPIEPTEIVDIEEKEKTDDELVHEQIETESKLKEKVWLEEKVKATVADDRKKQDAETAQTQADMRAQKEAHKREKARLKRLRRKERKGAGGDVTTRCSTVNEGVAESNKSKETRNKNGKPQQHPPPQHLLPKQLKPKFTPPPTAVAAAIRNTNGKPQQHPPPQHLLPKQLKPKFTPPPTAVAAAIRNRKRWWHWGHMVITVIILILSVLSFRSIDLHTLLKTRLA